MRIVSQDETYSVDMDRVNLCVVGMGVVVTQDLDNSKVRCLGVYESKERALEVFRDIHESYANTISTCYSLENEGDILLTNTLENMNDPIAENGEFVSAHIMGQSAVYYMPEI